MEARIKQLEEDLQATKFVLNQVIAVLNENQLYRKVPVEFLEDEDLEEDEDNEEETEEESEEEELEEAEEDEDLEPIK